MFANTARALGLLVLPVAALHNFQARHFGSMHRETPFTWMIEMAKCSVFPASGAADMSRPMNEVLLAHPGEDPWCHFSFVGQKELGCAASRSQNVRSYELYQSFVDYPEHMVPGNGTLQTGVYDGIQLSTRNHEAAYDDFYCHANGWIQIAGAEEKLRDYAAWSELSQATCQKLTAEFPGLETASFNEMQDFEKHNAALLQASFQGEGAGLTASGMRKHAAYKCALMKDVGCDLAFCSTHLCEKADGYIGHGPECHEFRG